MESNTVKDYAVIKQEWTRSAVCGQYFERISIYGGGIRMRDLSAYVGTAKEMELSFGMRLCVVHSL